MQPYNQTTPVKKANFEFLYNELLNERKQLMQEIQEYRNLEPIFQANKDKCDEAFEECEKFMQVLLVRYNRVVRSETEEKERRRTWSLEKNELREMISSLTVEVQKKDEEIQSLRSTSQLLQNRLKEVEENGHKLRVELDTQEDRIESLNRLKREAQEELTNSNSKFESLEKETINKFQQKCTTFDDLMDRVAGLHSDVNKILERCNIPADRIVKPVLKVYDEQIEAMEESIRLLDKVTSNAIKQEHLDQLEIENNGLRDELIAKWEELRERNNLLTLKEAQLETIRNINRCNKVNQKELEESVNKYANRENERATKMQQLERNNLELRYESDRYQIQVMMLQKEKDRLQEEANRLGSEAKAATRCITNDSQDLDDSQILCERNISLQERVI